MSYDRDFVRESRRLEAATYTLEEYVCDPTTAPESIRARMQALEDTSSGSVAVGQHPSRGWFILLSQGQGPVLQYIEDGIYDFPDYALDDNPSPTGGAHL